MDSPVRWAIIFKPILRKLSRPLRCRVRRPVLTSEMKNFLGHHHTMRLEKEDERCHTNENLSCNGRLQILDLRSETVLKGSYES